MCHQRVCARIQLRNEKFPLLSRNGLNFSRMSWREPRCMSLQLRIAKPRTDMQRGSRQEILEKFPII